MSAQSKARPLNGLRVIDLTTTIAGPYCARLLADAGADVVKIEAPEGELTRHRPPTRNGASTSYGGLNAGKRSLVLDLKTPQGVAVVRRLAAKADVLVENFRPGVMARFGLPHDALREANPKLVYCAISGFGQSGPSAGLAAYAPAIHASSGFDLAHMAHQPGRETPDNCGIYIADVLTGTYAYAAITTALVQRQSTGQGQMVDVSMLESMLNLTLGEVQAAQFPVPTPGRPMFGPVATRDGYIMPAVASERTFQNLARAAGREDWVSDPRFALFPDRRSNWGALVEEIEQWSRQMSTRDCEVGVEPGGRALLGVSHGCRGAGRPAARPSRGTGRGARRRRQLPRDERALSPVCRQHRGAGLRGRAGRAFARGAGRGGLHRGRDRGDGSCRGDQPLTGPAASPCVRIGGGRTAGSAREGNALAEWSYRESKESAFFFKKRTKKLSTIRYRLQSFVRIGI